MWEEGTLMKCLVVYYSMSGTTEKVANAVAGFLKCDIEEITEPRRRRGVFGFLRSGREAMRKIQPPIRIPTKDPAKYDIVIIGTPVWAGNIASPARTFLGKYGPWIKEIAFFSTAGSSAAGAEGGKTFAEMEAAAGKKPLAVLSLRTKEVKNEELFRSGTSRKIEEFAAKFKREERKPDARTERARGARDRRNPRDRKGDRPSSRGGRGGRGGRGSQGRRPGGGGGDQGPRSQGRRGEGGRV